MVKELESVTVDKGMYVNEATLELLQRRIESEVRASFLKSVTIPIGGTGLIAIVVAVFLWIPQKIEGLFQDPTTQQVLREEIEEVLASDEFKEDLKVLVDRYMQNEGRKALASKVEEALSPVITQVSTTIRENSDRALVEFDPQALAGHPKMGLDNLEHYTRPENVARIRESKKPVLLTKTLNADNQYGRETMEAYINGFRDAFGEDFKYVAVLWKVSGGEEEELVALIDAAQFTAFFESHPDEFIAFLNDTNDSSASFAEAQQRLSAWLPEGIFPAVDANQKVAAVLKNADVWGPAGERRAMEVAVVENRRLIGVTSRGHLLAGLLKY